MPKTSSSKTCVITGGSDGIGRAIAQKFLKEEIEVHIADLKEPEEQKFHYKKCDVQNAGDVDNFFEWFNKTHQAPDILVLNAGQGIQEKLTEGDPEKWQEIININLMGTLRFIRAFVPSMLERKQGHIVFISSVAANNPHTYGGIYAATKTALEIIAETLRLETAPHLKITTVAAGITDTNFFKNQISGFTSVENLKMGALMAEEIAEDVFYAINKPRTATINKIVTRPVTQTF